MIDVGPLEAAATFPYLSCNIAYKNSNWAVLYYNLRKVRRRWVIVWKIPCEVGGDGAIPVDDL